VAQTSTTTTELSTATTLVEGDSFVAFLGDEYGIPYDENTTVAEMLAALPTPTTRYQANQYGCHSDGRC